MNARFPFRIYADARLRVYFTVNAEDLPEGGLIPLAENKAAQGGSPAESERIFGGRENLDHEWVTISVANLEQHFVLRDLDMVPDDRPNQYRVRTFWTAKKLEDVVEIGVVGKFVRDRLTKIYNHATVYKNFGGRVFIVNLLDRPMRTHDRFGKNLNRSPKWVLVPVLAEEASPVERHDEVDLGAVVHSDAARTPAMRGESHAEKNSSATVADGEKFGKTNLGSLLKAKLGLE